MAKTYARALKQRNLNVIYYGALPTPALAYVEQEDTMSTMVTGSHLPFDLNGLECYQRMVKSVNQMSKLLLLSKLNSHHLSNQLT